MNSSTKLDLPLYYKLGETEDGQCHFLCFLAFLSGGVWQAITELLAFLLLDFSPHC